MRSVTIDIWDKLRERISVPQREILGRTIRFTITDRAVPINLTGSTVTIYATKPSGAIVFNALTLITPSSGIAEIKITEQMIVEAGTLACTLLIVDTSANETRTQPFEIEVVASPDITTSVESSSEYTALSLMSGQITINSNNIGDLEYTENNYVTDDDSLTDSVDKLDIRAKVNADAIAEQTLLKLIHGSTNRLVAHRGLADVYPENTAIAIERSCQLGYSGVEFDINETSDGELVVIHDDTVDRTTDGSGSVDELTLAAIQAMNVDAGANIAFYPNAKVPTFDLIMAICAKYKTIPHIEIKTVTSTGLDEMVRIINKYGMANRCVITSFSSSALDAVRALLPKVIILFSAEITSPNIAWCAARLPAVIATPTGYTTEALVYEAHQAGVLVLSYHADTFAVRKAQFAMGVDLMTTNITM